MGMVVRTNTMALNAYRQLGMNNSAVSKSLEKLSSGFRINRAGDDAAGLAISEKMKAQIKGLETASANAQDGISLIQTAEGNLSEVHDMLNRMVELSTKSANGTYTSTERKAMQDEMDQLLDEIDRISKSANFNGTKLLNGTMGLNNEALKIGETTPFTDVQAAGDKVITDGVTVDKASHVSGDAAQVAPKFSINFAEYKATMKAVTTTAGKATVGLTTADGKKIQVWDAGGAGWSDTFEVDLSVAAAVGDDVAITGADIQGKFAAGTAAGNYVKIGDDLFKVAGSNNGKVDFEWAGADKTTADGTPDTTGKVTDGTWVPAGKVEISVKGDKTNVAETATVDPSLRADCDITKVDDPVVGADKKRAGASLKLTADMVKDGAKLKIGDTTFTFSATAAANDTQTNDGDDVTISIKGVKDGDLVQYVTEQLSNFTAKATHTAADGTKAEATFAINREAKDTIHIDENATKGGTPDYAGFTETELKNVFAKVTDATEAANASVKLEITDNDKLAEKSSISVDGKTVEFAKGDDAAATLANLKTALGSGYDATIKDNVITISAKTAQPDAKAAAPVIAGNGLTLQIGDTADSYNKMTVKVADMSSKGLDLEELKKGGIMNGDVAADSIDKIKNAINTVSSQRATMGALQNRLEHTINNLDVAAENMSAANSRIRDTDMAKEMMNYTKMNVLVQSAQAMLAQANQQPQSVLQLLQ